MNSTDDVLDLPISSRNVAPLILCGPSMRRRGGAFADNIDEESQLRAIRGVLVRNRMAKIGLAEEIERLDALARRTGNEQAIDDFHYLFDLPTYQDAAHRLVAASLLVPFIEALLHRAVPGIEHLKKTRIVGSRHRGSWQVTRRYVVRNRVFKELRRTYKDVRL